jgi:hypothetical protein
LAKRNFLVNAEDKEPFELSVSEIASKSQKEKCANSSIKTGTREAILMPVSEIAQNRASMLFFHIDQSRTDIHLAKRNQVHRNSRSP